MLTRRSLTWYDLKQVSAGFVWIGCELVDLAPLQWNATLEQQAEKTQVNVTVQESIAAPVASSLQEVNKGGPPSRCI